MQGALPHNPLVTHETDVRHLRDPAFLRGALRYRVVRYESFQMTHIKYSLTQKMAAVCDGVHVRVILERTTSSD
jgi:hypothetical protein